MGEWFENRTEVQQDTKKVEKTDFQLVWVEQKEGQDELKINQAEFDRLDKWMESKKMENSDKSYFSSKLNSFKKTISWLSKQLDYIMDVWWWFSKDNFGPNPSNDIDIDDWQDTKYFREVANSINQEINNALLKFQDSNEFMKDRIDNIFSKVEKWTEKWNNVEKLSSFISKKEQEKQNWFTADNLATHTPGWNIVTGYKARHEAVMKEIMNWWAKIKQ